MVFNIPTKGNNSVKSCQDGGIKLQEETQTSKLTKKSKVKFNAQNFIFIILICITFRLTNLIRNPHYNRIIVEWVDRAIVLLPLILSLVLKLFPYNNRGSHRENNNYARNLVQIADTRNYGITYGYLMEVPKNSFTKGGPGPISGGDGVVIVGTDWRTTVINLKVRTFWSKAGQNKMIRGSGEKILLKSDELNIKRISNIKNLVLAYESIKSKPGNMTKGVDPSTLDGMNLKYLKNIQSELKEGKFEFKPARIIKIPKPGKIETRSLTIASPREKVIQKAILQVLEPHYEKIFLDSSHGFRPGRGTHTAMRYLEAKFQSVHYILEVDFYKAFDSIDHSSLMNMFNNDIWCPKTLKLIKSGLKAGYWQLGNLHDNLSVGTPQGSILSPLLCNIFLHKLDEFMEKLKVQYKVGDKRDGNPEYIKLQNKLKYWRKKGYNIIKPTEYKNLLRPFLRLTSIQRNNDYVRIHYVRYADDFVVGIEGSYNKAQEILENIKYFVKNELNLKLNSEKTGIKNYATKPFLFLGYSIRAPHFKGKFKLFETIKLNDRFITRRKKVRMTIEMDTNKVLKKLHQNGFLKKRTSHAIHKELIYRGTFKGNLINLEHSDIIRYYNSVVRGLFNYYSFVKNRPTVSWIGWLIKESCALTLARKFKYKSMRQVFKKFHKDLGVDISKDKRISFVDIAYKSAINISKAINITQEPLKNLEKTWNAKFTKSNLHKACIMCGNTVDVEMHHVRKIRDLKNPNSKLDFFGRQMAAINRKQVPLCKDHHIRLHNNTWTDKERSIFNFESNRKSI